MAVQPIRLFGDPILRTPAAPVETYDKELRLLVRDLTETMQHAPGSGLAAPQIGVSLRVFTYWVDDELGHLCNPELTLEGETEIEFEGCLSIPEYYEIVERPTRVKVRYLDRMGAPQEIEAEGLLATCLQHEIDHTNGVLFVDYLSRLKRERVMKKFQKAARLRESEQA
jgi:peptide deformylase